jgi:Glyoxalase-like domain
MACLIKTVSFDATDARALATFWAAALTMPVVTGRRDDRGQA